MLTATKDSIKVHDKEFIVHIEAVEIQKKVAELGGRINSDYKGKNPILVGVLNGCFAFMADLIKHLDIECEITFLKVASYSGMKSDGKINEIIGLETNLKGRHLIIVEDIVDTGGTINHLIQKFDEQAPASIKLATAIFKPSALVHNVQPDYTGFKSGPDFLLGYGMDYDGLGRNLQDIYILKQN